MTLGEAIFMVAWFTTYLWFADFKSNVQAGKEVQIAERIYTCAEVKK